MPLPLRSFFLAITLSLAPSLIEKVHAETAPTRGPHSAAAPRANYYGDNSRRALDGSRRDSHWGASRYEPTATAPPPRPLYSSGWREPALPAAPIWGGLYLGVHIGGGQGSIDTNFGDIDGSGGLVGGHIGYLARFGALAAGVEIDADWSHIDDSQNLGAAAAFRTGLDWLMSARARVGVDVGPALLYATGGVALSKLTVEASAPGASFSASDTGVGLVLGGGVQIPVNDRLALRLEALHYMFGEETASTSLGPFRAESDVTTVRAGVSLSFN